MAGDAQPISAFEPWAWVRRVAGIVQLALGASFASAWTLYAFARATIGDHDQVVSGNHDPKDLGGGIITALARALHALATVAAIAAPWTAIPFAALTLAALAFGVRPVERRQLVWSVVAVGITLATLAASLSSGSADDDLRHWILD